MHDPVSDVPDNFGQHVDTWVDQLDRAYQDGQEDLGNQLIELIREYEVEEIPAEIALPNLTRFIEASLGFTLEDVDEDDLDWLDDYDLENDLLDLLDDEEFWDDPLEFPEAA